MAKGRRRGTTTRMAARDMAKRRAGLRKEWWRHRNAVRKATGAGTGRTGEPLPERVIREMDRHAEAMSSLVEHDTRVVSPAIERYPPWPGPWGPDEIVIPELGEIHKPVEVLEVATEEFCDSITRPSMDGYQFVEFAREGRAESSKRDGKKVCADAGTASLNPYPFSLVSCGFMTTIAVPGPGQSSHVTVRSVVNASFGWLEALSFDPDAYGTVEATSTLEVLVPEAESLKSEPVTLLYGESPRCDGENTGIWHPVGSTSSAMHELQFGVQVPASGGYQLTVLEIVQLMALRYGDPRKCNACIQGHFAWDPTNVEIRTGCRRIGAGSGLLVSP